MMNQDNWEKNIKNTMVDQDDNFMETFRNNVILNIEKQKLTIRKLSEISGVPYATLNSFLYDNQKDCKLSTAIKLATALDLSIDEAVGARTLKLEERVALAQARPLPERTRYLIRWFIDYQMQLYKRYKHQHIVSIMIPELVGTSDIFPTQNFYPLDISYLPAELGAKIFMGFKIISDNYMPNFTPYDTILIANDREPKHYENSVIIKDGRLYIVRRKVENGQVNYYSIRDGKFRFTKEDTDQLVGYIVTVHYGEDNREENK